MPLPIEDYALIGDCHTAGPDTLELRTKVAVRGENMKAVAEFQVSKSERIPFTLNYRPSHEAPGPAFDPEQALSATGNEWRRWSDRGRSGARMRRLARSSSAAG